MSCAMGSGCLPLAGRLVCGESERIAGQAPGAVLPPLLCRSRFARGCGEPAGTAADGSLSGRAAAGVTGSQRLGGARRCAAGEDKVQGRRGSGSGPGIGPGTKGRTTCCASDGQRRQACGDQSRAGSHVVGRNRGAAWCGLDHRRRVEPRRGVQFVPAQIRQPSPRVTLQTRHVFRRPGTYVVTLRAASHRGGDRHGVFARIQNLDRVRVVVGGECKGDSLLAPRRRWE